MDEHTALILLERASSEIQNVLGVSKLPYGNRIALEQLSEKIDYFIKGVTGK